MNIVYLIGNGFDLNLGMKTSYADFYKKAYKPRSRDLKLIKLLKSEIKSDIDTWADLEVALGKFTSKLKNRSEFFDVFFDIRGKLNTYIAQQDKNMLYGETLKARFIEDMVTPYKYLTAREKNTFIEHIGSQKPSVSVISFNYTRSLENILGNSKDIKSIEHIHGFTNDGFILGVDNIEQIANESFRTDGDILTAFVKPRLNADAQHLRDQRCKRLIDRAGVICLFGTSIGETDKTWWNYIGDRLASKTARLIIFWKEKMEINKKFPDIEIRARNCVKELFYNKLTPNRFQPDIIQQIHVACNSDMFKADIHNNKIISPIKETISFDYSNNNGLYIIGQDELIFEVKFSKADNKSIYVYSDPPSIQAVALVKDATEINLISDARIYDTSSRARCVAINQIIILQNKNGFYAAIKILAIQDDTKGALKDEVTFEYAIQTNGTPDFTNI